MKVTRGEMKVTRALNTIFRRSGPAAEHDYWVLTEEHQNHVRKTDRVRFRGRLG